MKVELNHTIVWCRDKRQSAAFVTDLFDLDPPTEFGPMLIVPLANGISLDFYEQDGDIARQHYAFLVSESDFDRVFAKVHGVGREYWADPARQRPNEVYRHNGGRGIYFHDPDRHLLEVMTRPYDLKEPH